MKVSTLANPVIPAQAQENFKLEIAKLIPELVESARYGIQPIRNEVTQQIVGYEALGDPSLSKEEVYTYEIYGSTINVPVAHSNYKLSDKETVAKDYTVRIDESKLSTVYQSVRDAARLVLFHVKELEVKLFGLAKPLNEISGFQLSNDHLSAFWFGTKFLNLWVANSSAIKGHPTAAKTLASDSGEAHLFHQLSIKVLENIVEKYDRAYKFTKNIEKLTHAQNSSVVSESPIAPVTIKNDGVTINSTTLTKDVNSVFNNKPLLQDRFGYNGQNK